jgi:hypothetical protein
METSSLQKNRPHLEAVLGPLSAEDDAKIRGIFAEADMLLLEIAHHFHHDRAGWEGTGLELTWAASGQVSISSNVGARVEDGKCVDFCVELRPSWYYGDCSPTLMSEVETEIYADERPLFEVTWASRSSAAFDCFKKDVATSNPLSHLRCFRYQFVFVV